MDDDTTAEMEAWADRMQAKLDDLEFDLPASFSVDLPTVERAVAGKHPDYPGEYRRLYQEEFKIEAWISYHAYVRDLQDALTAIVGKEE